MTYLESREAHPVTRDVAKFPTPSIKRAYDLIERAVIQRASGCSFVALPRFGKSFAIDVLCAQLNSAWPNIPHIRVDALDRPRFTETDFFLDLLDASGYPIGTGVCRPRVLFKRLVNYLWTKTDVAGSDRLILFVDEAQNWHEAWLSSLRNITNALARPYGVRVIAVFFGQPQLTNLRNTLISSGRNDLVGRFLARQFEFSGITSERDLADLMSCYDKHEVSEYPINSGISYSKFFMPSAFENGWRLESNAPLLWTQFKKQAESRKALKEVGMRWVAASIATFFLEQEGSDTPWFKATSEDWAAAVEATDFSDSLG